MLSVEGPDSRLCDRATRRELLRVGGLSTLGLSLPSLLQSQASGSTRPATRAKSCILLWMLGGPSQHDTWDPKPAAPAEVRGDLGSIASSVPGVRVGALMPRTAALLDRIAVLRAVSTRDNAHTSSGYWMLTGTIHPRGQNTESIEANPATDWPAMGAIVRKFVPGPDGFPAAITLPETIYNNPRVVWPGQTGGFLGRTCDPWLLECSQSAPGTLRIPELNPPDDLPPLRLNRRRSLLDQANDHLDGVLRSDAARGFDGLHQQAADLLTSPRVRRAFDLGLEDPRSRDRYGPHKWGQCVLLARRLVEAGVPLVQVNWPRDPAAVATNPCWDIHTDGANRMKDHLMPPMDQGYSALLEDLDARGLLDSTLVVWAGEFGRTPRLADGGSRNHWGAVFSVAFAGAGVKGGSVHGSSDRIGAFPRDGLVEPPDLTATIFHALGLDPDREVRDTLGRPAPISRGRVLRELFL